MNILLCLIPSDCVRGVYEINGLKNRMPARSLFLHPFASQDFIHISDRLVVSDIYRSAESSLAAVKSGRGALPPGFSGHGYGFSIDLDVYASMKRGKFKSKKDLDLYMESFGFYCFRRDHLITSLKGESHHWNYFGPELEMFQSEETTISPKVKTTSGYLERLIQERYGPELKLTPTQAQAALKKLKLYAGDLDGKFGPLSKTALRVFKQGWGLGDSDALDAKTQRTLAFVAAEKVFR
jgi:hypothetical protein